MWNTKINKKCNATNTWISHIQSEEYSLFHYTGNTIVHILYKVSFKWTALGNVFSKLILANLTCAFLNLLDKCTGNRYWLWKFKKKTSREVNTVGIGDGGERGSSARKKNKKNKLTLKASRLSSFCIKFNIKKRYEKERTALTLAQKEELWFACIFHILENNTGQV